MKFFTVLILNSCFALTIYGTEVVEEYSANNPKSAELDQLDKCFRRCIKRTDIAKQFSTQKYGDYNIEHLDKELKSCQQECITQFKLLEKLRKSLLLNPDSER
ncbi:MAG: hypothetical protein P4L22_00395 [Candidatus Babeliales bacterium]|nr:hypothetical protein [Candidatus Babeliales bacterium]